MTWESTKRHYTGGVFMLTRKRLLTLVLVFALVLTTGAAAWANSAIFWTAPNPPQEVFWTEMAKRFMAENPEYNIQVFPMAEAPSSEATILTAIAGGTAPAASENIFIGFGAELYESAALVPLDTLEGWDELIAARNMEGAIKGWAFPDGHYYILPIYSNPILYGWRIDILEELGVDRIPETYEEIIEVARLAQKEGLFLMVRPALGMPTWWERWFDFFTLYNAISGDVPFITGSEITADDEAVIDVFKFYADLAKEKLILTQDIPDAFATDNAIWSELGPWTFPGWKEQYPEMVYGETFALTMPPIPEHHKDDAAGNTFADAKGLVLYAQASEEAKQAVWDFIRWVFADPAHDLLWMETTSLPPVRDDLADNPVFAEYLAKAPELVPYAESLAFAVPPFTHSDFADIQTVLSEEGLIPVVRGTKSPEQAWEDAKAAINGILNR
jgi:multiple sugar transport system substrate-binding protein